VFPIVPPRRLRSRGYTSQLASAHEDSIRADAPYPARLVRALNRAQLGSVSRRRSLYFLTARYAIKSDIIVAVTCHTVASVSLNFDAVASSGFDSTNMVDPDSISGS
jgi:hypothetical protein